MENLVLYLLKHFVFMGILWGGYRLFVSGNTFHRTNRITLLLIFAIGMMCPLVNIPLPYDSIFAEKQIVAFELSSSETQTESIVATGSDNSYSLTTLLWIVYVVGILLFLLRYLIGIIFIGRIVSRATLEKTTNNKNIYVTKKKVSPFSWFGYVVISEEDMTKGADNIIKHELAHVEFGHSWDLLFAQLYCLAFWWNPFVWLLKNQLITVHEFQADQRVIEQTTHPNEYRKQLIHLCVGAERIAMAHNFETSNLKKRIYMTMKNKSTAKAKWGYAALALAATLTMSLTSTETIQAQEKEPQIVVLGYVTDDKNPQPLFFIDGKEATKEAISGIPADNIGWINVLKDEKATKMYGEKGKNGVVEIYTQGNVPEEFAKKAKDKKTFKLSNSSGKAPVTSGNMTVLKLKQESDTLMSDSKVVDVKEVQVTQKVTAFKMNGKEANDPLLLVDGKEMEYTKLADLGAENIQSIVVLKDKKALEAYGEKGKNGVILITLIK